MFKKKIFFSIYFIWIGSVLFAQLPEDELSSLKAKYPESHAVSTLRSERVVISMVNNEPEIRIFHKREILFTGKNSSDFNTIHVPSSGFFEVSDLKATSLTPKGNKYKSTVNTYFTVNDNLEGSIFHDDMVIYSINFPHSYEGSKGVIEYKEHIKEAHFFGSYFFDTPYMPTEKSVFEVVTPDNIELDFTFFNLDSSKVNYSKKSEKGTIIHTWVMNEVGEVKMDRGSLGYKYHSPHMVARIKSITKNGKKESYLANVNDLHSWYYHFIKDVNKESSPILDSIALAITKDAKTDLEKVRSVFYWVQDNIKYIAFEDGLGGFVPRNAKDICDKRYGDCKDMTSIMHQMLAIAGVKSNMTWIGTTDIPYTYLQAPSPASDNHMILAYKNGEDWMFVDGTSTFNELGMPSSFIQGKEALIHIDSANFVVKEVPIISASKSEAVDSLYLKIIDNKVVGTGIAMYTGYYKQRMNSMIEGKTKTEEFDLFDDLLEKGSNKFLISEIEVLNKRDREKPLLASYTFSINDYISVTQDELFLNLHFDKSYLKDRIDAKRKLELTNRFAFKHRWYYELEIPEGYEISYLPENAAFTSDLFGFAINYKSIKNKIIVEFNYYNEFMTLFPDKFEEWNNMISKMNTVFKKSITLRKIK